MSRICRISIFKGAVFFSVLLFADVSETVPRSTYQGITFKVGRCTAAEYYEKSQACSGRFYSNIRIGDTKTSNCSGLYTELKTCMLDAFDSCLRQSILEQYLVGLGQRDIVEANYLAFVGDEDVWCKHGGLAVPKILHEGTNCHPIFSHLATGCVEKYHRMFNSQASLPGLCREYNTAKVCLFRRTIQHCSFTTRPMQQMMELLVEMELMHQPYCQSPLQNDVATYTQLLYKSGCPPYSHSDILFVADVGRNTSDKSFASMKASIRTIVKKFDYGTFGIRAGFIQIYRGSTVSIKIDRHPTADSFLHSLNSTTRFRPSDSSLGLMRGALGENLFGDDGNRSGIRPHHAPLSVVFTTGQSSDEMKQKVEELMESPVTAIVVGPHLRTCNSARKKTIKSDDAFSFEQQSDTIAAEICQADRRFRETPVDFSPGRNIDAFTSSPLQDIHRFFSRFSETHLPLWWVPKNVTNSAPSSRASPGVGDPTDSSGHFAIDSDSIEERVC